VVPVAQGSSEGRVGVVLVRGPDAGAKCLADSDWERVRN